MYTVALHLMVYQNNQHSFFSTSLTITLCLKIEYNPIFDEKKVLVPWGPLSKVAHVNQRFSSRLFKAKSPNALNNKAMCDVNGYKLTQNAR